MNRILIADDEVRIVSFIEKGLRAHGFVTTAVHDGASAASMARDEDFDLVILDIGMPRLDGFEVLAQVRGRGEKLPIIMLTARDEVDATVQGFEGGADDYVTKPFRFDELLARIRARLRATGRDDPDRFRNAGGVVLDVLERRVQVGGDEVELSDKEFRLADTLMSHAGQVLSREQLLSRVWGYDFDPGSNVVDVYIGYLRKKLGADKIETVRGAGYRFKA